MIFIKKILFYLLLLCYVYSISFVFLPFGLKSAMVVGVLGLLYLYSKSLIKNKYLARVIRNCFPILIWGAFSTLVNFHLDTYFPRLMTLNIVYAAGALFLIHYSKEDSKNHLLKAIVWIIVFNNVLAFLGMFSSDLNGLLMSVQHFEKDLVGVVKMERATGLGNIFFGGGVKTAMGMIFSCYLYKRHAYSLNKFLLIYSILLITGLFIARTSLLGFVGLTLFLFPLHKNWYKLFFPLFVMVILLMMIPYIDTYITENLGANYAKFAFGIVESLSESGELDDRSVDNMIRMYNTIPHDLSTWIIGDGLMNNSDGSYYMHTDIGYFRIIFSMGLIGLFLYIWYTFQLLRMSFMVSDRNKDFCRLMVLLFLFQLAILAKGEIDIWGILYLLIFSGTKSNRKFV